jgi:hypothetical protein
LLLFLKKEALPSFKPSDQPPHQWPLEPQQGAQPARGMASN